MDVEVRIVSNSYVDIERIQEFAQRKIPYKINMSQTNYNEYDYTPQDITVFFCDDLLNSLSIIVEYCMQYTDKKIIIVLNKKKEQEVYVSAELDYYNIVADTIWLPYSEKFVATRIRRAANIINGYTNGTESEEDVFFDI